MHIHPVRFLAAALGISLLAIALACDGSSRSGPMTPAGPSAMGTGGMAGGGMVGMPGMGGLSMAVASEFDYLAQMIPHHEEAVVTARLLEAGTSRPEMRAFARSIIETQSAEIVQMRSWLGQWYAGRVPAVTYMPMMRDLTGLRGDALDQAFLTDMIPHHMTAVMLSQQHLVASYARHPETLPFAAGIADTQRVEIQMMHAWLLAWFGASGMPQ